ncbi:hypothetical protein MHYP_G00296420 [Metynnis hypsauchen]
MSRHILNQLQKNRQGKRKKLPTQPSHKALSQLYGYDLDMGETSTLLRVLLYYIGLPTYIVLHDYLPTWRCTLGSSWMNRNRTRGNQERQNKQAVLQGNGGTIKGKERTTLTKKDLEQDPPETPGERDRSEKNQETTLTKETLQKEDFTGVTAGRKEKLEPTMSTTVDKTNEEQNNSGSTSAEQPPSTQQTRQRKRRFRGPRALVQKTWNALDCCMQKTFYELR